MIKFFQTFLSIGKIIYQSKWRLNFDNTPKDRCVILGNGPSIKSVLEEQLDLLSSQTLVCVNNFPNTPYFEKIKPAYFIVASEEFWEDSKTIDPNTQLRKDIINALINKTTWPITFFLPASSRKKKSFIQRVNSNKNIKICFYNKTPVEGISYFNHLFFKKGWGMPRPHNVLIPAIMNCINSGFKEIILLGADHSWIPLISVNEKNEALVAQKHFYNTDAQKEVMFRKGIRPRRLHEILEKFMLSFRAYIGIKEYAKNRQVQIWNATSNSFIDAFDRKKLKSLIHKY